MVKTVFVFVLMYEYEFDSRIRDAFGNIFSATFHLCWKFVSISEISTREVAFFNMAQKRKSDSHLVENEGPKRKSERDDGPPVIQKDDPDSEYFFLCDAVAQLEVER